MLQDTGFKSATAWIRKHSAGFRDVGPFLDAEGVFGLGVLEQPRRSEQSTLSQHLKLKRGTRYLLSFTFRTGYGREHHGYQELFVSLNDEVAWRADLAVADHPPGQVRLLFEAPANDVTLNFGKRGLQDSGSGWNFQSTLSQLLLRPAAADEQGDLFQPGKPIVAAVKPWVEPFQIELPNRFAAAGQPFSFEVVPAAPPGAAGMEECLRGLQVRFPGFRESGRKLSPPGKITITGHLERPGFFPFRVGLGAPGAQPYWKNAYACALPKDLRDTGAFQHHGYYVFLSRKGLLSGNQLLGGWGLEEWKKLADWMQIHGADQLWFMLNCYWLAFPSQMFPNQVDATCANAKSSFLKEFIDYAHAKGIKVHLAFTCEDYVEGYAAEFPEARAVDRDGKPLGSGLCLEHGKTREFLLGSFREALQLYPNADGIAIHANEAGPLRFNPETRKKFSAETGKDLGTASEAERLVWYAEKQAEHVAELYRLALAVNPKMECVFLDCPWFHSIPQVLKRALPEKVKICMWHYLHHGTYLENPKLRVWAQTFGAERMLFMPNGFNYNYPGSAEGQLQRHLGNDRLLSAAESLGCQGSIYYTHFDLRNEEDRLRDLLMAKYPTSSWVDTPERKAACIDALHKRDYFEVREELLRTPAR